MEAGGRRQGAHQEACRQVSGRGRSYPAAREVMTEVLVQIPLQNLLAKIMESTAPAAQEGGVRAERARSEPDYKVPLPPPADGRSWMT